MLKEITNRLRHEIISHFRIVFTKAKLQSMQLSTSNIKSLHQRFCNTADV